MIAGDHCLKAISPRGLMQSLGRIISGERPRLAGTRMGSGSRGCVEMLRGSFPPAKPCPGTVDQPTRVAPIAPAPASATTAPIARTASGWESNAAWLNFR